MLVRKGNKAMRISGIGLPEIILLLSLLCAVFMVWPWAKIFTRTGQSGWLGALMLIPMVNLAVFLYLAFGEWPIERELRERRAGRI